ncbi:toxin VasX [Psychrobacter aquaticus]|uniref:Toxin VasX N-terminal region domain-containing protein n=1 Tax=Psychrobacter aquaticus CMS 56 TaxID=1354303 RepID=U4T428_9GAMM|nr:toxin VasX [Psychrobacter aquaticus]ERL54916.1 hypothetical protein M917_2262 [Psychrobacter aquaticus CMS 56]
MSNDLSFMDRLTSNHKSSQDKKKAEPVVLELEYEIPTDDPSVLLDTIIVTATKKCDYECGKTGIPILPVVLSKTDYKVATQDERYFAHEIASIPSTHTAVASLPNHAYLYCYIEDSEGYNFDEYYTGADGALKRTKLYIDKDFKERPSQSGQIDVQNIDESDSDSSDEEVQPFNCDRKEHSTLESKYITLLQGDTAWLMVSHAKLSKSTLKKYVEDEGLRNKRMQKFVTDELTGNKHTVNMSTNEVGYIKSFSQRKQLAQGGDINEKINVLEKNGDSDVLGSVRTASSLYQSMQRSIAEDDEDLALEIKPMMVALPDPVGEVIAAAEKRNYLLKKLDDSQKDKGKIREQVNAIIIDNIKSSIEANTKERIGYDDNVKFSAATATKIIESNNQIKNENYKNIYKYINESKFKAVLESAKKNRQDKAAIATARQTFIDAITRSEFAFVMREDFLENDEDSHSGYAQIIAEATQGIGIDERNIGIPDSIWADYEPEKIEGMTAKKEFEQSLLPCISGQQSIEDNWLMKALIGLNKEDINRLENPPAYENLARASDFIGTTTSWVVAFKVQKQKQQITAKINMDIEQLNKLANHKAQIVQTMSSNMSHIKDNNKLLHKLDLWQRASVYQSTGFKLAQKFLKHSPEAILKWSEQRLSRSVNNAKPHQTLLPASIDNRVVSNASSVQAPIAFDLVNSHGVDQKALDIFDQAAAGDEHARTVVTMYTTEESARTTQTINQDMDKQAANLNRALDPINGEYQKLERSSAGKAALISAGIALFQLRSVWMGKSTLSSMARRGDRAGLEFMTGYASTSLALTSASLDVANAGLQMKAARSAWVTRLSLSVGVLGAVGAGFEVYSLSITRKRLEESSSRNSVIAVGVAQGAAVTAGISGAAIALGFTMPWLVGIMAVAWGVSLIAQWVAFRYDKGHILPVHYWLDAGVFGNKAMLNSEYPNNPFNIQAMSSLEQDMHAYSLALTEIQVNPQFATNTANFRQTLSGQIEITLSQWNDNSELVVEFIGIGSRELGLDRKSFNIETLKRQNQVIETSKGLKVVLDIPKTSHFQAQYLGSYREGTRDPNKEHDMQEAREIAQANAGREVDKLRAVVKYALNPSMNPYYQLRTSVTSQ